MFVATATEILPLFLYYIVKNKLCNEKPMNMMTRGKAKRNEGDSLMIEQKYEFTLSDSRTVERIVSDGNADINHIILRKGDRLPEHNTNSSVYMIVVRGEISLRLEEQDECTYPAGNIIAIPYNTKMNARNNREEVLEFFVVKAPSPKTFPKESQIGR